MMYLFFGSLPGNSMLELRENPDKNLIEIKIGTELKEHVRNDKKKPN